MTALITPAQARRDDGLRPVPWRRMAWVTWRQNRLTLASVVAALGAASVYLYFTGEQLHHQSFVSYGAGPGLSLTSVLFQVIAPLVGAFVGAPVLAREFENGTFRYTWTQGFGRARWTAATLAPLALYLAVLAGAFGLLFSWCYGPQIDGQYTLSPLAATTFDLRGITLAAWTLVAFTIGVVAGILIRRVVPAMFATIVTWSGLAVVTGKFLRPHYESLVVTSKLKLPSGAWIMSQQWTRDGKSVSLAAVNQALHRIGATVLAPGHFGQLPNSTGSAPSGAGNVSPTQYLLHHGFTQLATYQPASRFWPFQWIEGGWLLAVSLLLIGAAIWLVHRRAA
ncbi:MAG: hypothetical protein HKL86_07975 [Acidimicrobiaceae bacterium]|nr:hypothetical protein [Acidimicrobiaceae bacterium]